MTVHDTDAAAISPIAGSALDGRFSSRLSMAYMAAIFVAATVPTLVSPALVDGWQVRYGWNESQLGLLAGSDLAGLAIGGGSALFWQRKWPWRVVTMVSLIATTLLNFLCIFLKDFDAFLVVRLLAGIGAGVLTGVFAAFLANVRRPERLIAGTTFAQIALQGLALALAGDLNARFGLPAVFFLAGAVLIPLAPFTGRLPIGWPRQIAEASFPDAARVSSARNVLLGVIILGAFVPLDFFLAIYSFLPAFGRAFAGLSVASSLSLLGMSLFPSAVGPALAFVLGERTGIAKPLVVSALLCIGLLVFLSTGASSPFRYFIGVAALQAGWCFLTCYFYAAVIVVDNRLVAAATPVAAISNAFGASVMGFALDRGGPAALTGIAIGCVIISTLMVLSSLVWKARIDARKREVKTI